MKTEATSSTKRSLLITFHLNRTMIIRSWNSKHTFWPKRTHSQAWLLQKILNQPHRFKLTKKQRKVKAKTKRFRPTFHFQVTMTTSRSSSRLKYKGRTGFTWLANARSENGWRPICLSQSRVALSMPIRTELSTFRAITRTAKWKTVIKENASQSRTA